MTYLRAKVRANRTPLQVTGRRARGALVSASPLTPTRLGATMSDAKVTFYRWNDMPIENVTPLLDRRLITGDKLMLATYT